MIQSKYIEFHQTGSTGKTDIWNIISKKSGLILGRIKWYGPWRSYCFYSSPNCIFNVSCMDDIKKAIQELMLLRRIQKKQVSFTRFSPDGTETKVMEG